MQTSQPISDSLKSEEYQMPPTVMVQPPQSEMPPRTIPNPTMPPMRMPGLPKGMVRPWWFWPSIAAVPSVAVAAIGITSIVVNSGNAALVRSAVEANSAISMAGMKNRTNVTLTCGITCWGLDTKSLAAASEQPVEEATTPTPQPTPTPQYARAIAIDGAGLNIYQGDRVINTIPAGDPLRVIQQGEMWTFVEWVGAGGLQGWVKTTGVTK